MAVFGSVLLLLLMPPALTWLAHRSLASAASEVELRPPCERTGELREGDSFVIFASPPSLEVMYACPGSSALATRDAADAALRDGGFELESDWRAENFTDTGPVQESSWTGHGTYVIAITRDGEFKLIVQDR